MVVVVGAAVVVGASVVVGSSVVVVSRSVVVCSSVVVGASDVVDRPVDTVSSSPTAAPATPATISAAIAHEPICIHVGSARNSRQSP